MPTTISGTTGITTDGLVTSAMTYSGTTAPALFQDENRVINGSFDFWQRGTSFTGTQYGADRWYNGFIGGSVTMSRQSFTVGDTLGSNSPTFFMRQSVSGQTLASHNANIVNPIEGVHSYAGQTITVLGWARRSSGSGNFAVNIDQYFGTGGSPSAVVNIAGQVVTLTGSWSPFAVTFSIPSIAGKTLGSNGNDNLSLVFWSSAGSDLNSRSGSLGIQTIGVDFWGIHIRVGTHTADATSLYRAPELGPELARCQRYYIADSRLLVAPQTRTAGTDRISVSFPTTMRGTPAVGSSISSGGGTYVVEYQGPGGFTAGSNSPTSAVVLNGYTADSEL